MCGGCCGSWSGDFEAIRILSNKLVCVNQPILATCAETWVVEYILKNYTYLSFGRDLYDVEFGDSYGHQTVIVGNCESMCNIEEPILVFETLLLPLFER